VIGDKLTQFLLNQFPRKILNVETHWGSAIGDNFITVKMIVITFFDFPDPDKSHRALAINDFFTSFVNVCISCILLMSKGINYLSKIYVNNLYKLKPPYVDVHEDQCSGTIFFLWFLYLLEFFLMSNSSTLGVVFRCRVLIRVLRSIRHEVSQFQTKLTR